MLPVPDGGLGDADELGDLPLKQTKVHSFLADVLADGDGMLVIPDKWLFLQGDGDLKRMEAGQRKVGKGAHTPVSKQPHQAHSLCHFIRRVQAK